MEKENKTQLNVQSKPVLRRFFLKPKKTIFIFLIGGLSIILIFRSIEAVLIAGIFVIIPSINLILVKNRPLLDIQDEGVFVYDAKDSKQGIFLGWNQIEEYGYETGPHGTDIFMVHTVDGRSLMIPSADYGIIQEFKKRIPDAERIRKAQKEREERKQRRRKRR